ncbi:hypothetical protein TUM20985_40140 [Mycobacterium antarcticum]|nr:hypothetical protein TUM20985_40140 [Mycolicibacterium sp. TUM20985]GLP82920.1 hypothetical protein TUM20984_43400 [Mycolicibacterium sp. TUM20984]
MSVHLNPWLDTEARFELRLDSGVQRRDHHQTDTVGVVGGAWRGSHQRVTHRSDPEGHGGVSFRRIGQERPRAELRFEVRRNAPD